MRTTFKVYERLKREQHINTLFQTGKAYSVFPLRIIYLPVLRPAPPSYPAMVGFSVPKKKFKRSVDRHRIRRQMVEAWRLNKHKLYAVVPQHLQLHIFLIFTDNKLPDYPSVEQAMLTAIDKMMHIVAQLPPQDNSVAL